MNYWTTQISRRAAFTNEDTPYYTMTGYMLLRVVDDRVCTPQCQWRSARLFFSKRLSLPQELYLGGHSGANLY
jgi:hypothetical protein